MYLEKIRPHNLSYYSLIRIFRQEMNQKQIEYDCTKKDFSIKMIEKSFFISVNYSAEMISFLLYDPQALQTLCGIISSPHLLHFTKPGTVIFQFALRLSRLAFELLFLGQIDIRLHLLKEYT